MLKEVRKAENNVSLKRKIMYSILIAVLGVAMGLISKFLDTTAFNELPLVLQKMDIVNFFGRFAIWIFICVCISAYSCSPKRAAINTFLFLLAMVTSYYLYSYFVAGFFPKTYALIWFSISVASIFIAYICWYSKGEGFIAVCISAVILGVLFSQSVLLFHGIRITHALELMIYFAAAWVLRQKPRDFALEIVLSIAVAFVYQCFVPYWG